MLLLQHLPTSLNVTSCLWFGAEKKCAGCVDAFPCTAIVRHRCSSPTTVKARKPRKEEFNFFFSFLSFSSFLDSCCRSGEPKKSPKYRILGFGSNSMKKWFHDLISSTSFFLILRTVFISIYPPQLFTRLSSPFSLSLSSLTLSLISLTRARFFLFYWVKGAVFFKLSQAALNLPWWCWCCSLSHSCCRCCLGCRCCRSFDGRGRGRREKVGKFLWRNRSRWMSLNQRVRVPTGWNQFLVFVW